ncbi:MAG: DNA recombination protein RmuC, partial [Pseudomonadota bacterium]|nr:DNA recombination protein RmuC [Pseudomonadota bacterium]
VWAAAGARRERTRADEAEARLGRAAAEVARLEERARLLESTGAKVEDAFKAMSAEAVAKSAEELLKRAEEAFQSRDRIAQERLARQLQPVAETLTRFEAQVSALEKTRAEETGGLKQQIEALMQASAATQTEARKLTDALKRGPGVRGRWGEQTLRNVLEAAGMDGRFDFTEQLSVAGEDGRLRPDVVVKLPGGGSFVIDAKVSLNAFLDAQETKDDAAHEAALHLHAESVKRHMGELSRKAYWDQFDRSPDFVAMFIPGDAFLCAALDRAPDLMTEALARRVVIVTPTTLFALLKAVAYGWRAEEQAANAAQVAELGKTLYQRLSVMGGHAAALGKALDGATAKYNAFVGSLESQVLTQARRFEELSVDHAGKEIPELAPLESAARPLLKLAAGE